ncbi:uncharacterized protein J4E88_007271 [Alternaria novae-zelandiae]|uniref:uncharacterized protein n=1 Tax=Alternaria novae-zelandiae TaxID=430562 RepID=UPI0020C58B6A|nr:uncharacterized protein J4E88_007271 [Alternaria novae-zelandiae]KAI4676356.1 hypothetical protein J4E88_007271 [Alternaria novae-zelandiae]
MPSSLANREDCNNKLDIRRYEGAEKDSRAKLKYTVDIIYASAMEDRNWVFVAVKLLNYLCLLIPATLADPNVLPDGLLMKTCVGRGTVDKGVAFEVCAENSCFGSISHEAYWVHLRLLPFGIVR